MHVKGTDKQADHRINTPGTIQAVRSNSDLPVRAWGAASTLPPAPQSAQSSRWSDVATTAGPDQCRISRQHPQARKRPSRYQVLHLVLLTSKKWRLQREGRQSRRKSVEMKSDWLFDKPRPTYWLRVAASNLASQSPCLAGVTQCHCNPQGDFLRFFGRLLGPEDGVERVLGQTCDFS